MPSMFDRFVGAMWPEFQALTERVNQMAITQAQVDTLLAKFQAALAEIVKDINELKASAQVGAPMSQDTYDKLSALADSADAAGKIFTGTTTPAPEV
jgi:acyl-CoA reductase-like NAD-dependent aldehyde dehydrogenase